MAKVITNPNKIKEVLDDSKIERIYPSKSALEKVLKSGKRLTIYHGIDPTGSQLHLGHSTNYFILRKFQELGHRIILLIGDFTACIGDPSDKAATRKPLTREQVLKNAKGYRKQLEKILNFNPKQNPIEIKFNSSWLDKLTFEDLVRLSANFTVFQLLKRDMFQQRIKGGKTIGLHEFLYPIMQGYDSVAMDVDIEIGGNDQMFNMLIGRDLMEKVKNKEKFVITTKLLIAPGTDKKIMNKSEGRYIALEDSAKEMYGKTMALPDEVILTCLELCTEIPLKEIREIKKGLSSKRINPRDAKARLAREIVSIHHGKSAALRAEKEFNRIFKEKKTPSQIKTYKINVKSLSILDLLTKTKLLPSKSEAKRLVDQRAVKLNNKIIIDWRAKIFIKKPAILQVGKRKFIKII
jgi:tyrosyl-tRNA synthetase